MKQKTIELVNFLHHLVVKKKLLKSNQSMILAISGGQDSISLLFIFIQLKNQWNWELSIIYCNHLWQKDSFYTMLHLFKLAYLLGLPLYLTVTLQKILTENKVRNWRSLTFQRIIAFYYLRLIVTGHSKSDRIETGFFNLFRGSGTQGIGSLNWTKVISKDSFFKLNKNHLKQISIKFCPLNKNKSHALSFSLVSPTRFVFTNKNSVFVRHQQKPTRLKSKKFKFLVMGCIFLGPQINKPICTESLENFYKTEKKTLIQLDLLKPIVSKIDLKYNRKNSINFLKLKQLHKYGITNVIKKFLIYKIATHFKCNFKNKQNKNLFILKTKYENMVFGQKPYFHNYPRMPYPKGLRTHDGTKFLFVGGKGNNALKIKYCNLLDSQISLHNFATDLTDIFAYIKTNIKKKGMRKQTCTPTLLKSNILKARRIPSVTKEDSFIETKFLSRFYKNKYTLVRPFLSLTRFDLKKVCNSWKIPLFPDQSNQKLKYQRNRIRKQILPALRFFFNFQIDTTIYQFIEILNSEQEYMDFITNRIVNEIQCKKQTIVELETSFINILPLPIRRKIIKQFLEKILKKNLKFFDIEKVLQQISRSKTLIRGEDILPIKKKQQKLNKKKIKVSTFNQTKSQNLFQIFNTSEFVSNLQKKEKFKTIQKDILIDLIDKNESRYRIYKLIFFPKIASIFLQSQRIFFIKKDY